MIPETLEENITRPVGLDRGPQTARAGVVQVLDEDHLTAAAALSVRAETFGTGKRGNDFFAANKSRGKRKQESLRN